MSILKRLFGKSEPKTQAVAKRAEAPSTAASVFVEYRANVPDLVQLAGTMTGARAAVTRLVERLDPDDNGYLELAGVIQREPDNPVDPSAVVVMVEGERVGYLPGFVAKEFDLSTSGARPVRVQIFTQLLEKGLRIEAWAWLGTNSAKWQWSEKNRPPMSPTAKNVAQHRGRDQMVKEALAGGGTRAAEFKAGMVDGLHYLQTVEPIKQFKREGRLDEALELCYQAIQGAENAARREKTSPPPFYTEQAAIIHRKLKQRDEEIAVLQRYVDACPPKYKDSGIKARLDKLTAATEDS
ncbi:hypothetical protein ACFY9N_03810 [Microbacterium sp. NPDC008134]|uniref:hypothetical protein n=1 Tax=Microbacterium sp. NPDC008134 TaxID=3364183 RepID=UPI0036E7D00D